jgi:hypothetical protein
VDYANQPLPSGYDLVWSRDSLQHIPMHGVWQFMNNVKASGAKYLLVGSYIKVGAPNREIGAGGCSLLPSGSSHDLVLGVTSSCQLHCFQTEA